MAKYIKIRNKYGGVIVSNGSMIPPWHGIAYINYESDAAICYPVPINIIIAIIRNIYIWLKRGSIFVYVDPRAAYNQGFLAGRHSVYGKSDETD